MKCSSYQIISVSTSLDTLSLDVLLESADRYVPRPILWHRDGLYRLIPTPILTNLIDVYNNRKKTLDTHISSFSIRWEQGIDVDPKIARILLGE